MHLQTLFQSGCRPISRSNEDECQLCSRMCSLVHAVLLRLSFSWRRSFCFLCTVCSGLTRVVSASQADFIVVARGKVPALATPCKATLGLLSRLIYHF